jgi:hypothetical protein
MPHLLYLGGKLGLRGLDSTPKHILSSEGGLRSLSAGALAPRGYACLSCRSSASAMISFSLSSTSAGIGSGS